MTAPVRLASVTLEGLTAHNVRASVNGGQMNGSLLGMSFLNRFSSMQFKGGKLVLTP
jgi:aspartyl protease family protein